MADAAELPYESLATYEKLQELIDTAEAESLHLECKAPAEPKLGRDLRAKLAEAVSGFSNTAGGVILWGVSTTKHAHSGLDVLSQLEPVGHAKKLAQQIERAIPTLTTPAVTLSKTKLLPDGHGSSRGVIVTYIPQTLGDPIQSTADNLFHFRNGDEFGVLPYLMLQRLFAASQSPELEPIISANIVKLEADGTWVLPVAVLNQSSAVGEHVKLIITVLNPEVCASVAATRMQDISALNPGQQVFTATHSGVVHRGLNEVLGDLRIKMNVGKRPKRVLRLRFRLFANRMRARQWQFTVALTKKGFQLSNVESKYLY